MSNLSRRRRADAERSSAAVLGAAIDLLGRRPQANMEEIAAAAGVTRQTVYAHYASRETLLRAIMDHVTAEVVAAFEQIDVTGLPAPQALGLWVDTSWQVLGRFPILLTEAATPPPGDELDRHLPISGLLVELLERGRAQGQFDARQPVNWQVAALLALGHAAGQEVAAGRMSLAAAGEAFRSGVLSLCLRPVEADAR